MKSDPQKSYTYYIMIRFQNVSKKFYNDIYAVADLNFTIEPGEFVLLTGPSGSGKTTIMRLLTREYIPTEGEVHFDDALINSINNSKIHTHRRKIGVVFQNYLLIPELNVWENIALPLSIIGKKQSEIEERVTDLLELVSLTERALHFPKELSGGEAQRISIARALATAPQVLFADEPTGNLDPSTSLSIAKLLKQINELGTTIVFSTHDPIVIESYTKDRHIILDKGQIIKDTAATKKSSDSKKTEALVDVEDLAEETVEPSSEEKKDQSTQESSNAKIETSTKKSSFSLFSFLTKTTQNKTEQNTNDQEHASSKPSNTKKSEKEKDAGASNSNKQKKREKTKNK